ncbi:MAG: dGTP triphosphohydrolase [Planctomycetota bacterium]
MDRLEKEAREREKLHPAAVKSAGSVGRLHPEPESRWRTCFERDRDRIIHSSAFRRLEYKTQVFINHVGDHLRTRLTHSLEVNQVSRSLAAALDLNEPLVEAVALAHDVGHPPFGHTGEALLDKRMQGLGGFAHNRQGLRVVELLERRSPDYPGLNLTGEVRNSLGKHEETTDPGTGERVRQPLLEAQLVDLADSTAYHYHDVDDGIRSGILHPAEMAAALPLWAEAAERTHLRHPDCREADERLFWLRSANEMLGMTIEDLQEEALRRLAREDPKNPAEAQRLPRRLIGHSESVGSEVARLHRHLYDNFYQLDEVKGRIRRATALLDRVFSELLARPDKVPAHFQEHADCPERAVCDYVSGMTDRYVERIAADLGVPA